MRSIERRPSRGFFRRAGAAAVLALAVTGAVATPAYADPPRPPTVNCDPSVDSTWIGVLSAEVSPVLTQFLSVNVTPGTTGSYTRTLTRMETVTTTVNKSAEITAEAKFLFLRVSATVGFQVQNTKSTTETTGLSMTWNFAGPGYYGMYRGTRRVKGEWVKWVCARTGPASGVWVNAIPGGRGSYTTYEYEEDGTVSCASREPNGSLRFIARTNLGCPGGRMA